ncbi:MAG: LysM peptidoglycan-binding domain-containing protein [Magnetospirillum sp.]|nr:LysM peptidoglycan-binding domain-containing protein [Magnetospirillum sp.]
MNKPVIISIIGLAVAVVAAVVALDRSNEDRQALPPAVVEAPASAPADTTLGREPTFDVVRIDKNGDTVIAGRAMPKAEVVILDGGTEIGRTIADNRGEWVFVPSGPLKPGARELSLRAENPDGTIMEATAPVVLVVPERDQGQAIVFKVLPGGGSTLLQGPVGDAAGQLSIDTVDHDDRGRLFVGGKAPAKGRVHVYLDNRFLGRADADAEGRWRQAGKRPEAGRHVLRADLVGDKGKVLARIEVMFDPGEAAKLPENGGDTIVVMSGNSLWRIARAVYGAGAAYTAIFSANRDRIRDPDLIYPGQVFTVPSR